MSFFRIIIWGIIFYIVMKIFRSVSGVLRTSKAEERLNYSKPRGREKISIDSKDIIEAEFEEVKTTKQAK